MNCQVPEPGDELDQQLQAEIDAAIGEMCLEDLVDQELADGRSGKRPDDSHAIVEISGYLNDFRAVHHGLGQLTLRNLTIGNHDKSLNTRPRRISGCGGGCVAS